MRVFAASLAEMWSSVRRRSRLSPEEATAELMLARRRLGPEAPADQRALELVLAAAAGPATERELAGQGAAINAFLAALPEPERARPRRSPRRVPVLAVGVMLVALVAICGTAEAGALPAPLQQLAHQAINAPAPSPATHVPQPGTDVTPGPGGTGNNPGPGNSDHSQPSSTGKPSDSSKPTNSNSQGDGNGPTSSSGNGTPSSSASARSSATDNGQGNGGTPGQGGNPSAHPTGNSGNGNG